MKLGGVSDVVRDVYVINRKNHLPKKKKRALLFAYIKIRSRRIFFGRSLEKKEKVEQSFLGFTINVQKFSDFYWTFKEIFVDEDYRFDSKKENPEIIDLGGNIGMSILYFKWMYPDSKITVFEALSENAEVLKENIKKNQLGDIEVIVKAVGAEKGTLTLYGDRRAGTISKSLIDEQNKNSDDYVDKRIEVEIVPLSPHVKGTVDFLKMDIEGAEGQVIAELGDANKLKDIKAMAMEYHHFSTDENSFTDIVSTLEKNSFQVVYWSDFRNLGMLPKRKYYNFMLYAKTKHI